MRRLSALEKVAGGLPRGFDLAGLRDAVSALGECTEESESVGLTDNLKAIKLGMERLTTHSHRKKPATQELQAVLGNKRLIALWKGSDASAAV